MLENSYDQPQRGLNNATPLKSRLLTICEEIDQLYSLSSTTQENLSMLSSLLDPIKEERVGNVPVLPFPESVDPHESIRGALSVVATRLRSINIMAEQLRNNLAI